MLDIWYKVTVYRVRFMNVIRICCWNSLVFHYSLILYLSSMLIVVSTQCCLEFICWGASMLCVSVGKSLSRAADLQISRGAILRRGGLDLMILLIITIIDFWVDCGLHLVYGRLPVVSSIPTPVRIFWFFDSVSGCVCLCFVRKLCW